MLDLAAAKSGSEIGIARSQENDGHGGRQRAQVAAQHEAGILVAPSSIGVLAEHAGFRPTYAALSVLLVIVSALAGRAAMADDRRNLAPAE